MPTAYIIGGTGFVGRHVAADLRDHGYDVTVASRGAYDGGATPLHDVEHVTVDRTDHDTLAASATAVDPDVVVDCAAFHPADVEHATELFADTEAYVYVSSGGVYAGEEIPKREDETPLHAFSADQADDDTMATYGPRKAECDRIARAAADRGVPAISVRPTMIYGPTTTDPAQDPGEKPAAWAADMAGLQDHHDYWIDRVDRNDRVVVPGDGTAIWHRIYVPDLARAIRIVVERGTPGEAYNVADRRVATMQDVIEQIAAVLETDVEIVHASARELERVGLEPDDFVLYHHLGSDYPHVLSTCKLAALGWESTPVEVAMDRTVRESLASDRDGSMFDPGREAEAELIELLTG